MSLAFQTRLETHKYHGSKHVFTGFTQRASEGGNCPREISPANNRSGRERGSREGRSKEEKDGNEVGWWAHHRAKTPQPHSVLPLYILPSLFLFQYLLLIPTFLRQLQTHPFAQVPKKILMFSYSGESLGSVNKWECVGRAEVTQF